jgi:hypothetical protein
MLGLVVCGLCTWIWDDRGAGFGGIDRGLGNCSGVTGTAGFLPGESAELVTAHEMMILRCMPS